MGQANLVWGSLAWLHCLPYHPQAVSGFPPCFHAPSRRIYDLPPWASAWNVAYGQLRSALAAWLGKAEPREVPSRSFQLPWWPVWKKYNRNMNVQMKENGGWILLKTVKHKIKAASAKKCFKTDLWRRFTVCYSQPIWFTKIRVSNVQTWDHKPISICKINPNKLIFLKLIAGTNCTFGEPSDPEINISY